MPMPPGHWRAISPGNEGFATVTHAQLALQVKPYGSRIAQIPKLMVRVRFPSPASCDVSRQMLAAGGLTPG